MVGKSLLFTVYCLSFTVYRLLFTVYCSQRKESTKSEEKLRPSGYKTFHLTFKFDAQRLFLATMCSFFSGAKRNGVFPRKLSYVA